MITYLALSFWLWGDDRVHLVHVGADPLEPHAEGGHRADQDGQGPVFEARRLVLGLLADVEDRADAGHHADDCEDDRAHVQSSKAYFVGHFAIPN